MATFLDTFITKFRFESDRKALKKVSKDLHNIKSTALKIGATLFAVFSGGKLLGAISGKADELGKFADSIGISVEQLQELQYAAQRSGVPLSSLEQSLIGLQKVVSQAGRGYGIYGQVLARFGIAIRDSNGNLLNTFDLLKRINRVFQHTSKQGQFDLAQNLGINSQTVRLLQLTPKAFDALLKKSKSFGVITKKDTEEAAKFEDTLTDLRTSSFRLGVILGTSLFPILNKFIGFLIKSEEFLRKHKTATKSIEISIAALSAAFVILKLRALSAWKAVFWPVTIGAGIATALGLVMQDIRIGQRGGKSLSGPLAESIHKKFDPLFQRMKEIGFGQSLSRTNPSNNPYGIQPPGSMASNNSSVNKALNIGDININLTASTSDANILGEQIGISFKNMLKNSVNDYDNEFSL